MVYKGQNVSVSVFEKRKMEITTIVAERYCTVVGVWGDVADDARISERVTNCFAAYDM